MRKGKEKGAGKNLKKENMEKDKSITGRGEKREKEMEKKGQREGRSRRRRWKTRKRSKMEQKSEGEEEKERGSQFPRGRMKELWGTLRDMSVKLSDERYRKKMKEYWESDSSPYLEHKTPLFFITHRETRDSLLLCSLPSYRANYRGRKASDRKF